MTTYDIYIMLVKCIHHTLRFAKRSVQRAVKVTRLSAHDANATSLK